MEKRQTADRQVEQEKENIQEITEADFEQQQTPIRDARGNRWIRCEF